MKRIVLALLALVLLGGAAWWLWRGDTQPQNQPISLADGSVLYFRDATYGTNHQYRSGGFLGRILGMIPGKWGARFRGGARVSNPNPSITVWIERRGAGGPRSSLEYALGTGTNFAPARTTHNLSSGQPGGSSIEGMGFSSFPRRGRTVTLRFYDRGLNWGEPKLVGEFTFNNPAFSKATGWTPEPLPATKKVEDFEVTLKEVFAGIDRRRSSELRAGTNIAEASAHARLQFTRDGAKYDEWYTPSVEMSDATGNKIASSSWTGFADHGDYLTVFQPYLWADESAWKMRFELSRQTNFAAAELWTVRGIPVGATNLTNNAAFRTNLQGAALQLVSLDSGYFAPEGRPERSLRLFVRPDRPGYRLTLVEARDDQGRRLERSGSSWGGGDHKFDLIPKPDARSVDATFALHQSRYVEFLVAPRRFHEAAAKAETKKLRTEE